MYLSWYHTPEHVGVKCSRGAHQGQKLKISLEVEKALCVQAVNGQSKRHNRPDSHAAPSQWSAEEPLRRSALSVCPRGGPLGDTPPTRNKEFHAHLWSPQWGQTLRSPRPKVTSVLIRLLYYYVLCYTTNNYNSYQHYFHESIITITCTCSCPSSVLLSLPTASLPNFTRSQFCSRLLHMRMLLGWLRLGWLKIAELCWI